MRPISLLSAHRNLSWVVVLLIALGVAVLVGGLVAILGPIVAPVLLIPVMVAVAIFFNYRIGIVFLALLLPFSQSQFLPKLPGFNIIGYLSLATILAFGFQYVGWRRRFIKPPLWLLLFVLPVGFATVMGLPHLDEVPTYMVVTDAFAKTTASRYIKDLFVYPMLTVLWAWMLAHAMRSSAQPQRYVWLLCISSAIPALAVLISVAVLGFSGLQIMDMADSPTQGTRGLLSISGFHANEVGLFLVTAFGPLLFMTAASKSMGERLPLLAMLGVVTLALVLTFTRGAYLAAGLVVIFFLARGRGGVSMKLLALLAVAVVIATFGDAVVTRLMGGWSGYASFDARAAAATASRSEIWRLLWPDVLANPIFGNGLRSTAWSFAAKSTVFPTHPHNLYLEILLDIGLVGLVMLLIFYKQFASALKAASERCQASPLVSAYLKGANASFIGYLASGFTNWHYTPVAENTLIWAGLGVALACSTMKACESPATASPQATAPQRQLGVSVL